MKTSAWREKLGPLRPIDHHLKTSVGQVWRDSVSAASGCGVRRVLNLDHQGVSLGEDGDTGDQLSVGELFLQGGGNANVHVQAGVHVFEEAVPGAADSGPLNPLP